MIHCWCLLSDVGYIFWSCNCRAEPRIWICELRGSEGCRESHQYFKWLETSDQNHQGKMTSHFFSFNLNVSCKRAHQTIILNSQIFHRSWQVAKKLPFMFSWSRSIIRLENCQVEREPIVNLGTSSFFLGLK